MYVLKFEDHIKHNSGEVVESLIGTAVLLLAMTGHTREEALEWFKEVVEEFDELAPEFEKLSAKKVEETTND